MLIILQSDCREYGQSKWNVLTQRKVANDRATKHGVIEYSTKMKKHFVRDSVLSVHRHSRFHL